MIKQIFSNHKQFAWLFFSMLIIVLIVKLNLPPFPYRLITKPVLLILLIIYFITNKKGKNKSKHLWMCLALLSFLIGDILIINHQNVIFLSLSLVVFSLGKIFFTLKFSHKQDFKVSRLIPFTILIFFYIVLLIGFLINNLKSFFIPALASFFLTLLMFQFAYLRKDVFNKKSYLSVLFGIFLYTSSEAIMAIKTFRLDLPFQEFLIMLFYGVGLYFVVYGVVNEKEEEHDLLEKQEDDINFV